MIYSSDPGATAQIKGFTIVELLVVIVVIGILASVTIVGFNGVVKRAQYTQIAVTVKQYEEAFALYRSENGHNPVYTGGSMTGYCVGSGYPNYDGDPNGDCINNQDFVNFNFNEDTNFNNSIKAYIPSLPTIQTDGFVAGGNRFNGLNYMYDPNIQLDGVWEARSILFYYLQGQNQDCQYPVVKYSGSGIGTGIPSDYIFTSINANRWTYVNQYATACVVILPSI